MSTSQSARLCSANYVGNALRNPQCMLVRGVIPYYPQGRQQCLDKAACNPHRARILDPVQPVVFTSVAFAKPFPVAMEDQRGLDLLRAARWVYGIS